MHIARPATLRPPAERRPAAPRRALLIGVLALAVIAAAFATPAQEAASAVARAGPELTRLLRGMAMLKLCFAGAGLAAVLWRLGEPVGVRWFWAYAGACAAMVAGPVLIWDMAHIRLGALLLHAGLAACLLLLWRDPAVGVGLEDVLRARGQRPGRAA